MDQQKAGKITDDMNVADFKMVYYNPWDAQYLGYLVVDYSAVLQLLHGSYV